MPSRSAILNAASAVALLALAAGCSFGAPARPPVAPGTTAFMLQNSVRSPYVLGRLVLSIDGAALPGSLVPPEGSSAEMTRVPLGPGPHSVTILATARKPAGGGAEDEGVTTLHTQQVFRVGAGPAEIGIDLHVDAKDPHLEASFRMRGGELAPGIGDVVEHPEDARCAMLEPAPRAICSAELRLSSAEQERDIVRAVCTRDKLARMRAIYDVVQSFPGAHAGPAVPEHIRTAVQRIVDIGREIDRCVGSEIVDVAEEPTRPTLARRASGGDRLGALAP